jgi:hypothetical protein
MVAAMGQLIKFYVPEKFRKNIDNWVPPEQRGEVSYTREEVSMTPDHGAFVTHVPTMACFEPVWDRTEQTNSSINPR